MDAGVPKYQEDSFNRYCDNAVRTDQAKQIRLLKSDLKLANNKLSKLERAFEIPCNNGFTHYPVDDYEHGHPVTTYYTKFLVGTSTKVDAMILRDNEAKIDIAKMIEDKHERAIMEKMISYMEAKGYIKNRVICI